MGDGWSMNDDNPWVARKDLIPSDGPVSHPDPRMHLRIGTGDLNSYPITHRDWRVPAPLVHERLSKI